MISGQVSVLIGAPASRKIKLDVAPVVRLCRGRSPSRSQIRLGSRYGNYGPPHFCAQAG